MGRHPVDLFSLVVGILLTATAGGFIANHYFDVHVDPRLVVPLVLVVVGLAGLAGSLLAQRRSRRRTPEAP